MKHFRAVAKNSVVQSDKKYRLLGALVYILFFVLMIVTLSCKEYYFTDDIWSYILANNVYNVYGNATSATEMTVQLPVTRILIPSKRFLAMTLGVDPNRQLDYKQVIKNQAQDVHPPLYSILLHTLCSFCPGVFSKWFAGIINIVFALLTLFVLRKLICLFTYDKFILSAISYVFVFSSTILNSVACLRMYIMAMFWAMLCTYILVRYARRDLSKSFYASIFAVTTLGTLTLYYCALYFAFSYIIFALFLFYDKKYRQVLLFGISSLGCVLAAYIIFPPMLRQIIYGVESKEAFLNLIIANDLGYRLKMAFGYINNQLFGWCLPIIIATVIIAYLNNKGRKTECELQHNVAQHLREYCLLFLPCILFFLVVAKTRPDYPQENELIRYFIPIFALLLTGVLLLCFIKLKDYLSNKAFIWAVSIISFAIVAGSFLNTDWDKAFVHRGYFDNPYISAFEDADCIAIGTFDQPTLLYELTRYKSIVYFSSVQEAVTNAGFKLLLDKDKFVIGLMYMGIKEQNADSLIYGILQSTGNASQYTVNRMPYYYNYLYPKLVTYGYIYYITKNVSANAY